MDKIIKIVDSQSNQRIDKFLAGFYAEKSRASWQKGIRNKEVLVNAGFASKNDFIKIA